MRLRRTWLAGAANAVLRPVSAVRFSSPVDTYGRAERAAVRATGSSATVDPEFAAGMRVLSDALHAGADLTPIGHFGVESEIVRRLAGRLRMLDLVTAHPEIERLPLADPVFVTGLPRTGTTLLHGLLARHVGARAPVLWELMYPATSSADRHRRMASARRTARMSRLLAPDLRAIHPLDPVGPEECIFALPHSLAHCTRARIPEYREWYAHHRPEADYRYLRQHLQALQWGAPQRRWVLKTPFHLGNLDTVFKVFPEATVVWTHRDPVEALASWCSLVETVMSLHNRHVDPLAIGRDWSEIWAAAVADATRVRRERGGDRFIDVAYHDLTADPVDTTLRVWRRIDGHVTAESRRRITEYAARARRHRPGGHRYSAERYGLAAATVRKALTGPRWSPVNRAD